MMRASAKWIFLSLIAACVLLLPPVIAQEAKGPGRPKRPAKQERYDAAVPAPTLASVRYGEHERLIVILRHVAVRVFHLAAFLDK